MNPLKSVRLNPQKLIIPAVIFYILVFSVISLWKLENFHYNSLDLAIINQVFYSSAQGNFFHSSIHPPNYLGDHVSPILFLLLPFYFFYQSPVTLLILQTAVLALSAWPIYLIGKKIINHNWGVILSLLWLVNPFVQNINLFEFSFLPFAIFFILFTFYFFEKKDFKSFVIFSLLSLAVREDVALVIFTFGIISLIQKRSLKWITAPLIGSVIYFIAALKLAGLIAPGEHYKFLIYYSYLGNAPGELLLTLITKPWLILLKLFSLNNIIFTLGLLLPFVFVPLISPTYLMLGLGPFLQLALTQSGGASGFLLTHYTALLLPALFIGLIYSLKKINNNEFTKKYPGLFGLVFSSGVIYAFVALGPLPTTLSQLNNEAEKEVYREFIKKIPNQTAVSATYSALPSLSSREKIYSFNYVFLGKQQFLTADYALPTDTEYLLIDFKDFLSYHLQYGVSEFFQSHYQKRLSQWPEVLNDYGLVDINKSLSLWKKNELNSLFLIVEATADQEIKNQSNLIIEENLKFLGYAKHDNYLELFWEVKKLEKSYFLKINDIYLPLGYGLLNQDVWENKKVKTTYYFPEVSQLAIVEIITGGLELDAKRSTIDVIDDLRVLQTISIN